MITKYSDDEYFGYHTGFGSMHAISDDSDWSAIEALRDTVEEITGYRASKAPMGFDLSRKQ